MTKSFKLIESFSEQVKSLGQLKRAWFTTFNFNIDFFERHVLSALLDMDKPRSRIDFELMQQGLNGNPKQSKKSNQKIDPTIDVKIFADQRMYDAGDVKRTSIEIYGVNPTLLKHNKSGLFNKESLFHPKVIYLEDNKGKVILGVGSANLTVSGWSTNQEVFVFKKVEHISQLDDIKAFFDPICKPHNLTFKRPKLGSFNLDQEITPKWQFVHSFQQQPFLSQLFKQQTSKVNNQEQPNTIDNSFESDLVVWSPYFPADLVGYIKKLNGYWQNEHTTQQNLRVHLIPDLVENQRVRTQWDERLKDLMQSEQLSFYINTVEKDDRSDLCHAKVWMTANHIAIGSWNFTSPGSNIALKTKTAKKNSLSKSI